MIWGSMILWDISLYARFNEQPCDDMGKYDIVRIRKSINKINEELL
jgi:hypothetical protein